MTTKAALALKDFRRHMAIGCGVKPETEADITAALELADRVERGAFVGEWKTMESAPKDFTSVLLYLPEYEEPCVDDMGEWHEEEVVLGWFSAKEYGGDDAWHWRLGSHKGEKQQPAAWMPLPAPAAIRDGGADE